MLNWDDVWHDAQVRDGGNLVLHECAHLIDGASGEMDGVPPLPDGLSRDDWVACRWDWRAKLCDTLQKDYSTPMNTKWCTGISSPAT